LQNHQNILGNAMSLCLQGKHFTVGLHHPLLLHPVSLKQSFLKSFLSFLKEKKERHCRMFSGMLPQSLSSVKENNTV